MFLALPVSVAAVSAEPPAAIDFSRDVLPILSDNCFQCHGPDENTREADLRLDEEASAKLLRGDYAAIVPGESAASELVRRIASEDESLRMPPVDFQRKLTAEQIALLKRWIDEGAAWGGHWSFRKPMRPPLPRGNHDDGADPITNPIDAFILARLQAEGLAPSPSAPRETLARRVTLDLTGLPPTPEEVTAFVHDESPDAYERLVERLLASPAFGERMAWPWLDAARYADSNGYQGDGERTMWPWRDWVVDAFNGNLPYDQFTIWQLAGDLLPDATFEQKLATGFCRNHMINGEGGRIAEENRVDYVMDMAETTGTVWLGLTFNCCRCHDHKFDPLSQRDYYGLFAIFNQTPVEGGGGNPQTPPVLEAPTPAQEARRTAIQEEITVAAGELDAFEQTFFARAEEQPIDQAEKATALADNLKAILKQPPVKRSRDQLDELARQFKKDAPEYHGRIARLHALLGERDDLNRGIPRVMVMADRPEPRKTHILSKGLYNQPGETVTAATPAALPPLPPGATVNRLALARWLTSPEHPLTARVTVNRLWQQFFGVGLVKTPEDFGVQGERPSHPELLDWLAVELIESGWDIKALCRQIVTSTAYRQSSKATPALIEHDPENRLLARGPRFRMPAWMLRDQALAVSGLMVRAIGGKSVNPYQPPGVWEETTFGNKRYMQDHGASLYRRSVYTFWRRIVAPTAFFDNASRQVCTVRQVRTNTPLHALATLNDVTYVEAARTLAQRVLSSDETTVESRLDNVFRRVLARSPRDNERAVLTASVNRLTEEFGEHPAEAQKLLAVGESKRGEHLDPIEHAAWTAVCLAILNLDETLTKE